MPSTVSLREQTPRRDILKRSTRVLFQGTILLLSLNFGKSPLTACSPDVVTFSPTPILVWDLNVEENIDGYTAYCKAPGGVYQKVVDRPCEFDEEGIKQCPSYIATQKYNMCMAEWMLWDWCIKAYNTLGNHSAECSTEITICNSHIWVKPEHYN